MNAYQVCDEEPQPASPEDVSNEQIASKLFHLVSHDSYAQHAALQATVDHLMRQTDSATQTRGGRTRGRDLYSEAERILAKTAGQMSLLERLARDKELREDVMALLKELGALEPEQPLAPFKPSSSQGKKPRPSRAADEDDEDMTDVRVRFSQLTTEAPTMQIMLAKGTERWTEKEQQAIDDYYGCHPRLLEGIEVFMNSER